MRLKRAGPDGKRTEPLLFLDSAEIELDVAIEKSDTVSGGFEIKVCGIGFSLGREDTKAIKSGNKLKLILKPSSNSPIGVADDES